MGYFKRPIDRARSKAEARSLTELPLTDIPWQAIPASPPTKVCFVRFSALVRSDDSGRRLGFLGTTYRVLDDPEIDTATVASLKSALEWFGKNLPAPSVWNAQAIWFFKSSASTCMARAWELIHHLREAGVVIEMQTVERPGRILYEDEHQVAVVPWADAGVR